MTTMMKIIKTKVGLLELAKQLGNVSKACKMMGYSRDSFYRFKELYETGGETDPAAMEIDLWVRSTATNTDNFPTFETFIHLYWEKMAWK